MQLDAEVLRFARLITAKPRDVVATGKTLFYRQLETPLREAYDAASRSITCNMLDDNAREGVGAFLEKRKPNWD
jgi:enoyl-CoA hydratase/carnithine racemase